MATKNEMLADVTVSHQVGIYRLGTANAKKIVDLLNESDEDIVSRLREEFPDTKTGRYQRQRMQKLLTDLRQINQDVYAKVGETAEADLTDAAEYEAGYQVRQLKAVASTDMQVPPRNLLKAIVTDDPFEGRLLKEWVEGLESGRFDRLRSAVRMSLVEGDDLSAMIKRVRGTYAQHYKDGILEISRRSAEAMMRTAVNHVVTKSKMLTYEDNKRAVPEWKFVATLDMRTTDICRGLDGRVFPVGEGPLPPRHINCRSTIAPVVPGGGATKRKTYQSWLKDQTPEVQDEVLGKAKGRLFRRGGLTLDKFADEHRGYTLEELRKKEPLAFRRAGLISDEQKAFLKGYSNQAYVTDSGRIYTSNVNDAVKALWENVPVELDQPDEVTILLDRLARVTKDMERAGEKAPTFNLCNLTIKGTNLFCADAKGYPRIRMPQLKGVPEPGSPASLLEADPRGEVDITQGFLKHLRDDLGMKVHEVEVPASHLRASQGELNGAKVAKLAKIHRTSGLDDATIVVSRDNYIVDGHHRWAAMVDVDYDDKVAGDLYMHVARVDGDIVELLKEARKYAAEQGLPQIGVGDQKAAEAAKLITRLKDGTAIGNRKAAEFFADGSKLPEQYYVRIYDMDDVIENGLSDKNRVTLARTIDDAVDYDAQVVPARVNSQNPIDFKDLLDEVAKGTDLPNSPEEAARKLGYDAITGGPDGRVIIMDRSKIIIDPHSATTGVPASPSLYDDYDTMNWTFAKYDFRARNQGAHFGFNCVGDAFGDEERWWWPTRGERGGNFWPKGAYKGESVESFDELLLKKMGGWVTHDQAPETGTVKIALYGSEYGKNIRPTHAMRQLPSGEWQSKMGSSDRLVFDNVNDASSDLYGKLVKIYELPKYEWERMRTLEYDTLENLEKEALGAAVKASKKVSNLPISPVNVAPAAGEDWVGYAERVKEARAAYDAAKKARGNPVKPLILEPPKITAAAPAEKMAARGLAERLTSTYVPSSNQNSVSVFHAKVPGEAASDFLKVTKSREAAAAKGVVTEYKVKPGATIFPDLKVGKLTGTETLLQETSGSGVIYANDLVKIDPPAFELIARGSVPNAPMSSVFHPTFVSHAQQAVSGTLSDIYEAVNNTPGEKLTEAVISHLVSRTSSPRILELAKTVDTVQDLTDLISVAKADLPSTNSNVTPIVLSKLPAGAESVAGAEEVYREALERYVRDGKLVIYHETPGNVAESIASRGVVGDIGVFGSVGVPSDFVPHGVVTVTQFEIPEAYINQGLIAPDMMYTGLNSLTPEQLALLENPDLLGSYVSIANTKIPPSWIKGTYVIERP